MDIKNQALVSRFAMEIVTASILFVIGGLATAGSLEFEIGWDSVAGPQPGYFPFYIGLIIMASSGVVLVQTALARRDFVRPFVTLEHAKRVLSFFLPVAVFVALCPVLGIYDATALYLLFTMLAQGRYPVVFALAVSLGTSASFFVLFELLFKQPLLKGPVEAWFGFS
jgi:hypothetical protein